jgi:hypothetical protein
MLALLPMAFAAIYLGKLVTLRQANHQAAHSLAFECTVRPEQCADPTQHDAFIDEQRRREFSRSDAGIHTQERLSAPVQGGERQTLWSDRKGQSMLASYGDIGMRLAPESFDAGLGWVGTAGAQVMSWFDKTAGPTRFGLNLQQGMFVARIQTGVQQQDWFGALSMQSRAAILTDTWAASSAAGSESTSVMQRVAQGSRLPLQSDVAIDLAYAPTRGFISLMDSVGLEPQAGLFRYHHTDTSLAPVDRRVP